MLHFDGQVAVVTGAGRGIGAAHAALLAGRGAKVVVNDIGTAMDGAGSDATPAALQAERIRRAGGSAVPDTSDIATPEGAQSLVDRAIGTFGRLDIVVNNAGIYWYDAFPAVEPAQVQAQFALHVGGSFNVTRAAWPHFESAGYGRVVMTTSTGALGSATLTSYGSAKAGVIGLGRALAMAGEPLGVKVNMVAPMAMTRMMNAHTGEAEVPDDPERAPSLVSPLVAILCHRDCPVSGETYVSGMRRVTRLFIAETHGYTHPGLDLTPEHLLENWDAISDLGRQDLARDTKSWAATNRRHLGAATEAGTR
ncbi:SDR family NAD(P)-dependent oxidoreductase [Streptomyces sp. WMMC500]|uniref:SDR family NAD(P)-dependent oxidoreductase n=1 Tax=Streptomyces sp. WMMC500 TaxID=3015154 RepID=UPI00248BBD50|nr:SDR family NAD(P)-dependent oxidoreductase [Streptomyces sp. WMMC500]WBB61260.1 SDR family NAD(P)-dependent oxidoreductase [Streptomyces sp. WMMC500]